MERRILNMKQEEKREREREREDNLQSDMDIKGEADLINVHFQERKSYTKEERSNEVQINRLENKEQGGKNKLELCLD